MMLTEQEARELLAEAADTIELRPAPPVPVVRRTWPVLLAAVLVLVVAVGSWLAVGREPVATPADPTDPADPASGIGAQEIPNVFGYGAAEAAELLRDSGFEVDVRAERECGPEGRALSTDPAPGERAGTGETVTLTVSREIPTGNCYNPTAALWPLLDLANERGHQPPPFADEVVTYVNGRRHVVDAPSDRDTWGDPSVLDVLAAATTWSPMIQRALVGDSQPRPCGDEPFPSVPDSTAISGHLEYLIDGVLGPCVSVVLYADGDDRVSTIAVSYTGLEVPAQRIDESGLRSHLEGLSAAAQFRAFSRGEGADLDVAPEVRLYLGNEFQHTIAAEDVDDPSAWEMCAAYAQRSCPFSAPDVLRRAAHRPAMSPRVSSTCLDTLAPAPEDTGGTIQAVLSEPEPRSCIDDYAVILSTTDDGTITAVNLLLGSP